MDELGERVVDTILTSRGKSMHAPNSLVMLSDRAYLVQEDGSWQRLRNDDPRIPDHVRYLWANPKRGKQLKGL